MWTISKQFDFCYGHRVWSQTLNSEFSLDSCLKCRHLHGHQGTINISLQSETLQSGMVTDFKHLNWFKKWLDNTLDHKMILDLRDPIVMYLFTQLFYVDRSKGNQTFELDEEKLTKYPEGYSLVTPFVYEKLVDELKEVYEGLVFVDFVPTSENLSKWIFDIVQEKMILLDVKVSGVQFFETPKSQSNYTH